MSITPRNTVLQWTSASLLLVSVVASGCARGPSKADLTRAVDEAIRERICFTTETKGVPEWPLIAGESNALSLLNNRVSVHPIVYAMREAGYVAVTPERSKVSYMSGQATGRYFVAPTEEAKAFWTADEGFCVGTRAVADVQEWTEPTAEGAAVEVKFTVLLVDVPEWARHAAFDSFPAMKVPVRGTAMVHKTNNGWKPTGDWALDP